MPLPRLMVAPNGARLQKADHPAVPITLDEIVACAKECFAAGADGLHLHIRDADGNHLLDSGAYRDAAQRLGVEVPDLPVQVTTEAVGQYDVATQMSVALNSGAQGVSVAIREIIRDGERPAASFFADCAERQIIIQHILYDPWDAETLARVLPKAQFHDQDLQLLFVLGTYGSDRSSDPRQLNSFLSWMRDQRITPDWAACAFGRRETDCVLHAASKGGKCRVGFENSIYCANGDIAKDNAQRIAEIKTLL